MSQLNKNVIVLVVEDDPNLRRIIINIMKKLGFTNIREADNGQKAWMTINSTNIGLVLTDLNMPVMDGLKLSKLIRANAKYDDIPVLVITAADTKEIIVAAGKAGVDGYIIKPFDVKHIIKKIEAAFTHRESKAARRR